jgi:hypothetical protein
MSRIINLSHMILDTQLPKNHTQLPVDFQGSSDDREGFWVF